MITPRTTRLVRAADLRSFRSALIALATDGSPLDARDRLVIVPTRTAAAHLVRSIEDRMTVTSGNASSGAVILPDLITRGELHQRLFDRVEAPRDPSASLRVIPSLPTDKGALYPGAPYVAAEREALLAVACRAAVEAGADPPFRVRPGLVAAMLDFFDSLKRQQKTIDDFERLTCGRLEAGAASDRGADRLLRQTRFFAAAFRDFERRCAAAGGIDEHAMRDEILATAADRPWRHIVVAVRDRAGDPYGLHPVDWDLLARVPRLDRLDVVVTDGTLAGAFHERIHQWLPGIEEATVDPDGGSEWTRPATPCEGGACLADLSAEAQSATAEAFGEGGHTARDREEEVAGFARWVRAISRAGGAPMLDRMALVVRQRLPYVYLAREVFRSAGIPFQMFDALPLAAEPYAAALDVLFSFVSANGARVPAVALLRSPHFVFSGGDGEPIRAGEIAALDRALSESGYLGDLEALDRLLESWRGEGSRVPAAVRRAGVAMREIARELAPLRSSAPIAAHLDRLLAFLTAHRPPSRPAIAARFGEAGTEDLLARQLRARGAILGLLRALRDAYRRFDGTVAEFDEIAAMVRRGIEAQTFAPRSGESGVHLLDAESARFGEFDYVQLAGLVDGEWPERPRRNIFYSPAILRELGWPSDADRIDGARASFVDLLRLPAQQLVVSTFSLEHDAIVGPSAFLDDLDLPASATASAFALRASADRSADRQVHRSGVARIFEYEALGLDPVDTTSLTDSARAWAQRRLATPAGDPALRGRTAGQAATAYSVSALERYQDCPFKFFASDVLRLDELPEDEPALSPRVRGRFIHEVFQRFFELWDRRGGGTITSDRMDEARAVFAEAAAPLLDQLPGADASLERARLFGSAISVGIVDVVLGLEAARPVEVAERWLEYRLEGEFSLGASGGRRIPLKGVADRIDLLDGKRLRVIDYKSGYAPQPKRALQVPVYALCAQERLAEQRGGDWTVDEAAYIAFTGKRSLVPVIRAGKPDQDAVLGDARARLLDLIDGVERGEFPPRPHDPRICSWCAYPSVCRKDYVGDE